MMNLRKAFVSFKLQADDVLMISVCRKLIIDFIIRNNLLSVFFERLRNELTYVHILTQLPVNFDVFAVFKTMFFELR